MNKRCSQQIISIRNSPDKLNEFISEYKPFVASCVQKATGKYVEYGRDDELSIGLMAFHEAIDNYDYDKGNFFTFARQVIHRRIIDYYRTQKRYSNEVPLQIISDDSNEENEYDLSIKESIQDYDESKIIEMRKLEIIQLRQELNSWGINFFDVAKASPKMKHTKKLYANIIKHTIQDNEIVHIMLNKRYFPISKICEKVKINRKKIERGRNYIVAGILIMVGDYEFIRDFVDWR